MTFKRYLLSNVAMPPMARDQQRELQTWLGVILLAWDRVHRG